jgi:hypothetical protein
VAPGLATRHRPARSAQEAVMLTVTVRPGLAVNLVGQPRSIARLRTMMAEPAGLARVQRLLAQPGVVAVALHGRQLTPVAECARGDREHYPCAKADKMADYALHRSRGLSIGAAARVADVGGRTGTRYEAELHAAGRAPWRARDPNVLKAARRRHAA